MARFMCGLVPVLVICKLKEYGVLYDVECLCRDQVVLNNIKLKFKERVQHSICALPNPLSCDIIL